MWPLIFVVSLALVSIPLWLRFVRQFPNQNFIQLAPSRSVKLGFVDVGLIFFLSQLLQIGGIYLVCSLLGIPNILADKELERTSGFYWISVGSQFMSMAIAIGIVCLRHREGLSLFGIRTETWKRDLWVGLAGYIMIIPGVLALHSLLSLLVPYEHGTLNALGEVDWLGQFALAIGAVFAAPIYEEFFYRGALLGWLLRFSYLSRRDMMAWVYGGAAGTYLGKPEDSEIEQQQPVSNKAIYSSLLFTGAFFGLMHSGQGAAPIALTVLAIILGYLFVRTQSLLPCIVVHLLLNLTTIVFSLTSVE